jgi:AraC-like DNA-binding protein
MESEETAAADGGICIKFDLRRIIGEEAEVAGIDPRLVLAGDRRKAVIYVKQRVCMRLRNDYRYTLPMIGRVLGMDHTSVLHLLRRELEESPPELIRRSKPRIVRKIETAENLRIAMRTGRRLVELLDGMSDTAFSKEEVASALGISERYAKDALCAAYARGEVRRVRRGYYQAVPKARPVPVIPAVPSSYYGSIRQPTKAQLMGRRA